MKQNKSLLPIFIPDAFYDSLLAVAGGDVGWGAVCGDHNAAKAISSKMKQSFSSYDRDGMIHFNKYMQEHITGTSCSTLSHILAGDDEPKHVDLNICRRVLDTLTKDVSGDTTVVDNTFIMSGTSLIVFNGYGQSLTGRCNAGLSTCMGIFGFAGIRYNILKACVNAAFNSINEIDVIDQSVFNMYLSKNV